MYDPARKYVTGVIDILFVVLTAFNVQADESGDVLSCVRSPGGLLKGAGPGGMPSGRRACGEIGDGPAARSRRPGLFEDGSPEIRSTESRACRNGHGLGNSNPWNLDRGHAPRSSVSSAEA